MDLERPMEGEYRDTLLQRDATVVPVRARLLKRRAVALMGALALVGAVALLVGAAVRDGALPVLGWDDWDWKPMKPMKPMTPMKWKPMKPMKPMKWEPWGDEPSTAKPMKRMEPFGDFDDFGDATDDGSASSKSSSKSKSKSESSGGMKWEPFKPFKPFKKPFADFDGALPSPSLDGGGVPDLTDVLPKAGARLRWGIIGPTPIAADLAASLHAMGASIRAVAPGMPAEPSARVSAFASTYGVPSALRSSAELCEAADVDVVYVGTPSYRQATTEAVYATAEAALKAGKHVLLERAPQLSVDQLDELAALAKEGGRLLVLNYWTAFFPATILAENAVNSGEMGALAHIRGAAPPTGGAGSVLDLAQYFAFFVGGALGSPEDYTVRTTGALSADGGSEAAFRIASAKTGVEATFSLSPLRDRDDMAVAAFCARGAVHVSAPAEAPAGASFAVCRGAVVSQSAEDPCGGHAISQGQDQQSLPNYPKGLPHALRNGMGLAYIASAFERCAYTAGCAELKELTMARQRLIQGLALNVLAQLAH